MNPMISIPIKHLSPALNPTGSLLRHVLTYSSQCLPAEFSFMTHNQPLRLTHSHKSVILDFMAVCLSADSSAFQFPHSPQALWRLLSNWETCPTFTTPTRANVLDGTENPTILSLPLNDYPESTSSTKLFRVLNPSSCRCHASVSTPA